ncbi:MAG: hypothetical protein IKX48_17270, partial [Victivallales bacterium]|nr:hypothetical protein [Victivallales bacterium]
GKSVLLCNGQLRKHTGVQAAQRDRDNGMLQEIMVPWSAIGRREPPPDGSVWGFNVCRAFWSWKQLSSWSPVFDHFVMGDGRLEFGGFADEGNGKVDVSPKTLLPGMNRLSVTLPPEGVFSIALKWADGSVISRNDAATGKASLEVNLPQGKGGNAQLVVNQGDNMIADLTVPVLAKSDISFVSLTDTVIVGNIVRMVCMTRLPNLTIEREKLHVTILDGGQKPVFKAVAELMDGYSNVHISTDGLPAGRFTLVLSAGALDGGNDVSQARRALTLLRSPWAP